MSLELHRIFNPFDKVKGNFKKTSSRQKMLDAFQVLCGDELSLWLKPSVWLNPSPTSRPRFHIRRPGLFDFATLFIFRITHFLRDVFLYTLVDLKSANYKGIAKLGIYLAKALALPLAIFVLISFISNGIIRPIVAAAITLIFSPVILFLHGISKIAALVTEKNQAKKAKTISSLKYIFDPFTIVRYQSDIAPHSRSLHTNIFQKFGITFQVFDGGISLFKNIYEIKNNRKKLALEFTDFKLKTRPGLFDYFTLGTFRLIHALYSAIKNKIVDVKKDYEKSTGSKKMAFACLLIFLQAARIIVGIPHVIGNGLLRHAFSIAATLAFLPIIILSDIITKIIRYVLEKKAAQQIYISLNDENFSEQSQKSINANQQLVKLHTVLGKTPLHKISFNYAGSIENNNKTAKIILFSPVKNKGYKPIATGFFDLNNQQRTLLMAVNESARNVFPTKNSR